MSFIVHAPRVAALIGLCAAQAACLAGPIDTDLMEEDTASSQQAVASTNRLSMNRLAMGRLSMVGLSTGKLSTDGSELSPTPLSETADGRELLTYLIRCALPGDRSLTTTYQGTTYTFQGNVGIAPTWLSQPLTKSDQRWVSACLLAHINGYGIEVPISLRGELPALAATNAEKSQYTLQEAGFYGNVFVPTDDPDYGLYACAGSTAQSQCGATAGSYVPKRACGSGSSCALSFVGPCRNAASPELQACEGEGDTFVEGCFHGPMGSNSWSGLIKYTEVVTVFLNTSDFDSLYAGCDPVAE